MLGVAIAVIVIMVDFLTAVGGSAFGKKKFKKKFVIALKVEFIIWNVIFAGGRSDIRIHNYDK